MTENELPQLSVPDQRRVNRMIEKMIQTPRPLETTQGGRLANDAYGRVYMRDVRNVPGVGNKGAGNVRIAFDAEGKPVSASHRNKPVRKAELKAMRMRRKAEARQIRESRKRA